METRVIEIAHKMGLKTAVAVEALSLALEQVRLLDAKQQDYGPGNISKFGVPGLLVRINDKFERLCNLTKVGAIPKNESIEDSFMDMSNYCLIGRLLLNNKWNGNDYPYPEHLTNKTN